MAIIEWKKEDNFSQDRAKFNQLSVNVGDLALLIPIPNDLTGTASSVGTAITGTGSLFSTELELGDMIYVSTGPNTGEIRTVAGITDDFNITIDTPFTTDITNEEIGVLADNIVEAINYLEAKFKNASRRLLIQAIALN